ncbi:ABC transporter ATP-binding protein [Dyadobacter fermentans]|uniref:ABC transporter transmembrane region n=1 Tax=Dyadobacter fermentans (strain ATCC 700827 / DSM 18053 / CIP 107007 / KCTC 52180 / NS114) TaxID=471854 RepID=C6VYN2_DYAFD|nr:ABC transporter ATP-binding protein [Dyadobacter fermentans]ACT93387.1 ABC transporter transmembrane region [Dyadobacter fermentans DSM 18053]
MKYDLNQLSEEQQKTSTWKALGKLLELIAHERGNLALAVCAMTLNTAVNLFGPFLIGHAIDRYVVTKQFHGLLVFGSILLAMYLLGLATAYTQTKLMGGVGQRLLFTLRNAIFNKLQQLPVAFFNQNKAGDLISRVNNDTDKLNQFFSQSLMQFMGSIFTMLGAGIFLLVINVKLGSATLAPAVVILVFTLILSPWVKATNARNLQSTGALSAEIQESLNNFKVVIAFNRRDYFRQRFQVANIDNYRTSIRAGLANNVFLPTYSLFSNLAQLVVLAYGIHLISIGEFTVGLLVSYLAYAVNFYNPLRQLAALWTSFQVAMAGWDRVSQILALETDLVTLSGSGNGRGNALLEFRDVRFGYDSREILHDVNFTLERGKTYALIGPTGGGKTTTASLIARLYDPREGTVLLDGRDIRTYTPEERSRKIGFILQEPFLFSGTIRENILYGNAHLTNYSNDQLEQVIRNANLGEILALFENGLETKVSATGDSTSLGQKQLIAFMRAVLRSPELLILDEATANIDTVTEKLLGDILKQLPASTTQVIIAHRLNTIENADEIFFVNSGEVNRAGSLDDAMGMLLKGNRAS